MGAKKAIEGVCKLCGEHKVLNLEHVPPKSAYNKNTKYVVSSIDEWAKQENPFDEKIKGKVEQGGITFNAFCERCNNNLGNNYVNAYKDWADVGAILLNKTDKDGVLFQAKNLQLQKIIKHIVSMFIAFNDISFIEEFPELVEFIRDPNSTELDKKFRFFTYLNRGPEYRYIGYSFHGDITTNQIIKFSEIAYPPFGFVITIDHKGSLMNLREITSFVKHDPLKAVDITAAISIRETATTIPLDYRTKVEIIKAMEDAKKSD